MNKIIKTICLLSSLTLFSAVGLVSANEEAVESKADVIYEDTAVTKLNDIAGYNPSQRFLIITLSHHDYVFTDGGGGPNDYDIRKNANCESLANFYTNLKLNDSNLNLSGKSHYFVYYGNPGSIGIEYTSISSGLHQGDVLTIPEGTTFPSYKLIKNQANAPTYKTSKEMSFTWTGSGWQRAITLEPVDSDVTSIEIVDAYQANRYFMLMNLSVNDYNDVTENGKNDYSLTQCPYYYVDLCNFYNTITVKNSVRTFTNMFLNYKAHIGTISAEITGYHSFTDLEKVEIPAGTIFPSYEALKEGSAKVYKTTVAKQFVYYQGAFHCCEDNPDTTVHFDETGHWYQCAICGADLAKHEHHMMSGDKPATCLQPGIIDCTYCDECDYVQSPGTEVPPLGHDFAHGECFFDETGHWYNCPHDGCTVLSDVEAHTWGEDKKTCLICGFQKDVCFLTVKNGYIADGHEEEIKTGDTVTVVGNSPEKGMMFEGWYLNNEKVSSENVYTFVLNENMTIEAKFVNDPNYVDYQFPTNNNEGVNGKTKGCKGSVVASSLLVITLSMLGVTFVSIFKKN